MNNLQEATERICELKGSLVALDALLPAVIDTLSSAGLGRLSASFDAHAEAARTVMLHSDMSDVVLAAFEREVRRNGALLHRSLQSTQALPQASGLDPLLLALTPVTACVGDRPLAQASGFLFRREGQLFLVSARTLMAGRDPSPMPDRLELQLAVDAQDPTRRERCSLPLQTDGRQHWRSAEDTAGPMDVAVLPIHPADLPQPSLWLALDETHLAPDGEDIAIGDVVSMVGFPQGLSAPAHPLPIARTGSLASPLGMQFQDRPCFLTDMFSSEGCNGAPILRRRTVSRSASAPAAWQLLGVHCSDALDLDTDVPRASFPALHRAWSAALLMRLTAPTSSPSAH